MARAACSAAMTTTGKLSAPPSPAAGAGPGDASSLCRLPLGHDNSAAAA